MRLRLPDPGDEPAVVAACQDPEISRWTTVPRPYGPSEFLEFLEMSASKWGRRKGVDYLIEVADAAIEVADAAIEVADAVIEGADAGALTIDARANPDTGAQLVGAAGATIDWAEATAEVGYWLDPAFRGRGYATTAVSMICDRLVELGMRRLFARVMVGNPSSGRVLERLGFEHEGTLRGVAAHGCGVDSDRIDIEYWGRLSS